MVWFNRSSEQGQRALGSFAISRFGRNQVTPYATGGFIQIRDQGGYDLILNNVPGVVVMAADRIDITQQVIDRFNAGQ